MLLLGHRHLRVVWHTFADEEGDIDVIITAWVFIANCLFPPKKLLL
jgi:hypothetical protein